MRTYDELHQALHDAPDPGAFLDALSPEELRQLGALRTPSGVHCNCAIGAATEYANHGPDCATIQAAAFVANVEEKRARRAEGSR